MRDRAAESGVTYIEMMAALGVLMILATAVIPLARWDEKRRMENHLRVNLQIMRQAIDQYNKYMAEGFILAEDVEQCALPADKRTCYPLSLEQLVDGVEVGDPENPRTVQFLQRLPIDPFTGDSDWGFRSYQDDFDSTSWGGQNVYDVYSQSPLRALDGSYYKDW